MNTVLPSEFKRGMVLVLGGTPQVDEEFHVTGTAQTRHKLHARLRHLRTGHLTDHVFAENERVPVAELEQRRVLFSSQHRGHISTIDSGEGCGGFQQGLGGDGAISSPCATIAPTRANRTMPPAGRRN